MARLPPSTFSELQPRACEVLPLRVAVIGSKAGGPGSRTEYCQNQIEGVELISVCDLDANAVRHASERHEVPGYTDYCVMIERENLDAVVIATPNFAHAQPVIDALDAGLHVYCEKPMAHTLGEAERMLKASQDATTRLQIGYCLRNSLLYTTAHELVRDGWCGEMLWCGLDYLRPPWTTPAHWKLCKEKSGGLIVHESCHYVDFLRWVVGQPVTEVHNFASPIRARSYNGVLDSFHLNLRFDGGTVGGMSWTHLCGGRQIFTYAFVGTRGALYCDMEARVLQLVKHEVDENGRIHSLQMIEERDFSHLDWDVLGHNTSGCLQDFFARVQSGEPQLISVEESFETERVCHAAEQSAIESRAIAL